jgi:diaminohydroxyphosphoribosylaminopyrimidine deaminase/5-amino-6-(5-phosphoribosylamino)uracil reductase
MKSPVPQSEAEDMMRYCIQLARAGAGHVAPNPMVGAVLVHSGRIIGAGYHEHYGEAHAEVNCIASVTEEDQALIAESTLYVTLEPCAHHGKTPPCADLIIRLKIPKVVVGCRDPFPLVDGRGIEKLVAAGVQVETGVLENECRDLNKRFFTFHEKKRPYILLKWAQTADHKIGSNSADRLLITNEITNRLVHQWRSEEAAILVGTNTVVRDNPQLTNRHWTGPSPVRVVIDTSLRIPMDVKIYTDGLPVVVLNSIKNDKQGSIHYYKLPEANSIPEAVCKALYELKLISVMLEGGAMTLNTFITAGCWDEARVFTNTELTIKQGVNAPLLTSAISIGQESFSGQHLEIFLKTAISK